MQKKLMNFKIDIELLDTVNLYCKENGISKSQLIRNALVNEMERPLFELATKNQPVDLSTIDYALEQLNSRMDTFQEFLEISLNNPDVSDNEVTTAKALLLKSQPKTYEECGTVITDTNVMMEAMNQLLEESKVKYARKRFTW